MNIGQPKKEVGYTVIQLMDMGWTKLDLNSQLIELKHVNWLKENLEYHSEEAAWLDGLCICFRNEEDAFHFKLRWT